MSQATTTPQMTTVTTGGPIDAGAGAQETTKSMPSNETTMAGKSGSATTVPTTTMKL